MKARTGEGKQVGDCASDAQRARQARRRVKDELRGERLHPVTATPAGLARLSQAVDLALERGVVACQPGPIMARALADTVTVDTDLRSALTSLFGVTAEAPPATPWTPYLDEVEASVFDQEGEIPDCEQVKIARERFGFRFVRSLGGDDLPTIRRVFEMMAPAVFHQPLFPPGVEADPILVALLTRGRDARMLRLWHVLTAPFDADPVVN